MEGERARVAGAAGFETSERIANRLELTSFWTLCRTGSSRENAMLRTALLFALLFPIATFQGQTPAVAIETSAVRFEVTSDGSYRITDKAAGATWSSATGRFGQISVAADGKPDRCGRF
jgi:hypothetical protein